MAAQDPSTTANSQKHWSHGMAANWIEKESSGAQKYWQHGETTGFLIPSGGGPPPATTFTVQVIWFQ
jgi:hypothetical protein